MAYRASNVKRLQQTRPNTAAAPITPSPQSGTQIKTPTVGGLFNAPMNQEGLRTNQMIGNMGDSLFQAGQAAMKKRKQANQLFEITNKSSNFEIGAIDLENEIKSKVVSQEIPPNKMEEAYTAGLEKLKSGLTKDVTDPIVLAGVNKAIQSYVGKNYGKFAEMAFKAENESGLQTFYKNVRDSLSKQLGNGKADLDSFTGILSGLEEKKNAFVMAGIESAESMTKNIDAILKDVYQKELLDYSNVKELEGMRNSPKFNWVDKKSIDDRIKEIDDQKKLAKEAYKFNLERQEKILKRKRATVYGDLVLRTKFGAPYSSDEKVRAAWLSDLKAALSSEAITKGDFDKLLTMKPFGAEHDKKVLYAAMSAAGSDAQLTELNRRLGLEYHKKDWPKIKQQIAIRYGEIYSNVAGLLEKYKKQGGAKTSDIVQDLKNVGVTNPREAVKQVTLTNAKDISSDSTRDYVQSYSGYQRMLEMGPAIFKEDADGEQWLESHKNGTSPYSGDNDEDIKSDPFATASNMEKPIIQSGELREQYEAQREVEPLWVAAREEVDELMTKRPDLKMTEGERIEAIDKLYKAEKAKMMEGSRSDVGGGTTVFEEENKVEPTVTPDAETAVKAAMAEEPQTQEVQDQEPPDKRSAFAIPDDDEPGNTLTGEAQAPQVKETRKTITAEELANQEYPYIDESEPDWTPEEIERVKKQDKEAKIELIKEQLEKNPNAYPEYIITENGKPLNLVQQKDVLPPKDIPNRSYALAKEYSAVDVDTDKLIYNKSKVKGETVGRYVDLIVEAAKSQSARDLVPDFVALMEQESKFNNGAKSWTNVKGLVQMTQDLASDLGLTKEDITTPEKVIPAGFKHFKRLLGTFKSKEWAHIGWNAGWGVAEKLKRYGIDPGNWETTKGKLEQALRAFPKTYGPDKIPVKKKLKEVVKHVETIIRRTEEIKKAKAKG